MRATHRDGRESPEITEAEFHRTYGPAGFEAVDESAEADVIAEPEPQVIDGDDPQGTEDDAPKAKSKRAAKS